MTIALPLGRLPSSRSHRSARPAPAVPGPADVAGHPHGDGPVGSVPAAGPVAVALLGLVVVLGAVLAAVAVALLHLLRAITG